MAFFTTTDKGKCDVTITLFTKENSFFLQRSRTFDIQPTYKEVLVHKEWHNFQNFAEWYNNNYKENYCLDKDIICKDCKIYSSNTCAFVPREINNFFLLRGNDLGGYKLGVSFQNKKFASKISQNNKRFFLGYYNTEIEAHKAYVVAKNNQAVALANKYKNKVNIQILNKLLTFNMKDYENN